MKFIKSFFVFVLLGITIVNSRVLAQTNDRIIFSDREVWLNGGNVAWINFSSDIGPGETKLGDFNNMLTQVNNHGGNAMRLWLHINGSVTPAWNGDNVIGPGTGTIGDLTALLDAAEAKNIGLVLCLWSFDMLRKSAGSTITGRAKAMLQDSALTQQYIDNALIPMVQSVGDHPAVISWEIFNEPEGMSNEFGWDFNHHVPMADIQRFINQTAGAIHRTNPDALVSNGAWSFHSLANTSNSNSKNYYSDNELISAGKDSLGVLDFYMVHYYDWGGTELSPFHNTKDSWGLNKPVVVGEFGIPEGDLFGIPGSNLYEKLYENGYAGSLVWQWVDWYQDRGGYGDSWLRGLDQMQYMRLNYPQDIALSPIYPTVTHFSTFPDEITAGDSSKLQWEVYFSDTVTLNGNPVSKKDSLVVNPTETTTYQLIAKSDTSAVGDTASITVKVVSESQINRAFQKLAVSSTDEQVKHLARYATDGDATTRWSSSYADDNWIYIDLGTAYEINSVLLNWEVAYGSSYNIQTSLDAEVWNTVYEERNGDGAIDSLVFDNPALGRYVRMYGIERGTEFGFSLWEFEVRGLESSKAIPEVSLIVPDRSIQVRNLSIIEFSAKAFDSDGDIENVTFYLDGNEVSSTTEEPFSAQTLIDGEGEYEVYATATDSDGFMVQSGSQTITSVADLPIKRFEAETGTHNDSIRVVDFPVRISGEGFVVANEKAEITWYNIGMGSETKLDYRFRYRLSEGTNRQQLSINGAATDTLLLQGGENSWKTHTGIINADEHVVKISLNNLDSTIHFDYLELETKSGTYPEETTGIPKDLTLSQNYPNPFNPTTLITYQIPRTGLVELNVFNLLGQEVATLINEPQQAGEHQIRFDASELSSGIYLVILRTENGLKSQKITLIK